MEKVSWVVKIINEKVKACADVNHYCRGKNKGKATQVRKRMHLLSDLMKGKYVALKRTAEDREEW